MGDIADVLGNDAATVLFGAAFEDLVATDLPGGRNVADDYLRRRGWKESASTRDYIAGLRRSVISLYEVSGLVPGESMQVRDLVRGGDPVRVSEKLGSQGLRQWDRVATRVIPLREGAVISGTLMLFEHEASEALLASLRKTRTRAPREVAAVTREFGIETDAKTLAGMLALSAGWDDDLLRIELGELQADGFDLALTGFDPLEIAGLLAEPTTGLTDPDEVPEVPASPVSRLGDLWQLGRHRLFCGDSTDPAAVEAVLAGVRPHLMVTDPPYGVEYDPAWRNTALEGSKTERTGEVLNDHRADWREAWALFSGEVAYVWHGALHATTVADSLASCGFEIRAQIIWAKERLVMGRGHYHWQHEPCWYAVRGTGHWSGDRKNRARHVRLRHTA
jgi:hypothetical protein